MQKRWTLRPALIGSLVLYCSLAAQYCVAENVRIGVITPLTGSGAFWGENFRKGIELALGDLREKGDRTFEVIFEDEQCDPKTAVTAYQKLTATDHVKYFLGPVCSSATLVERAKTPLITCAESADIPNAGGYLFRLWVPNDRQWRTLARYAVQR